MAQLELGNDYAFHADDFESSLIATPILGFTERFEVSSDFPVQFLWPEEEKRRAGFSDINLILKGLILKERKTLPALLLRSQIKFSNADEEKGLGSGDEDYGFIGVASKTVGPVTGHANFGYVLTGDHADETFRNYFVFGFALEYAWSKNLNIVGEFYGESAKHFDATGFKHNEWNPLFGLVYKINDYAAFDISGKVGFQADEKPEYAVIVGLALNQLQKPFTCLRK